MTGVVPALLAGVPMPALAEEATASKRCVLLVVDGLGWHQLQSRLDLTPNLCGATGGEITTVAPSTTAAALTSIATGTAPGEHGIVGYRVRTHDGIMNCLTWRTSNGDARETVDPAEFQPLSPFLGSGAPVVTRAEFRHSGFSEAHLRSSEWLGWHTPSSILGQVRGALERDASFVYAYYDGLDKVGHVHGVGAVGDGGHFEDELRFVDMLVGRLRDSLPDDVRLVVTADHGMIDVGKQLCEIAPEIAADTVVSSGEARFLWLHTRPGRERDVMQAAKELYSELAWVVSLEQVLDEQWLGPLVTHDSRTRLGDVAIVACAPVAFVEAGKPDGAWMVGRHGGLTPAEMAVPLLVL